MMEIEDNAESVRIEDLYDIRLFFILELPIILAAILNVVIIPPTKQIEKAFKALPQCEKHGVRFLIMII